MGLASPFETFFGHGAVLRGRFHGNCPQSPTAILVSCDRRKVINSGEARLPNGIGLISFRCNVWRQHLAKGTLKWFNPTKGYGFIQPVGGSRDVFVHISAVERAGLSTLNEGQSVEIRGSREQRKNLGRES